jgi:hypothetical protein
MCEMTKLVRDTWLAQVRVLGLPASEVFDFAGFLANPSDVRDWNIQVRDPPPPPYSDATSCES